MAVKDSLEDFLSYSLVQFYEQFFFHIFLIEDEHVQIYYEYQAIISHSKIRIKQTSMHLPDSIAVNGIMEDKSAKVCKASKAVFSSIQKSSGLETFFNEQTRKSSEH